MREQPYDGQRWLKKHLVDDVEELQMIRQYHVHQVNPDMNQRELLAVCKSSFLMNKLLVE